MSFYQVLVRLERLLRDLPSDPAGRRAHERAAVPWVDEKLVKQCPSCARDFVALHRRKHHCRLCGGVMCSACSDAVEFDYARAVLNPVGVAKFRSGQDEAGEVILGNY